MYNPSLLTMVKLGFILLGMFLRFAWNFVLFTNIHPFGFHIVAIGLDHLDNYFIEKIGGLDNETYQIWDKMSDLIYSWFLLAWLWVYRKRIKIAPIFMLLILYRTMGSIIFMASGERVFLAIFFDAFTLYFLAWALYDLAESEEYFRDRNFFIIGLIFNVGMQIWREIGFHTDISVGIGARDQIYIFFVPFLLVLAVIKRKKKFEYVWRKYSWNDITEGTANFLIGW